VLWFTTTSRGDGEAGAGVGATAVSTTIVALGAEFGLAAIVRPVCGIARDRLITPAIRDMGVTGAIVRPITGHHIHRSGRFIVRLGITRGTRAIVRL
jgi:hypothetical protein